MTLLPYWVSGGGAYATRYYISKPGRKAEQGLDNRSFAGPGKICIYSLIHIFHLRAKRDYRLFERAFVFFAS